MTHLAISVLGPLRVILDGAPVTAFESDKVRALLAYLAVEADHPHRRETLAGLFWPERPERSARHNLSQALSNLRSVIGDRDASRPFFLVTRQTVRFNRDSDHSLDVAAFAALLSACNTHDHRQLEICEPCVCRLREAAALYHGPLLDQFYGGDSPAFEEWVLVKREGLQRQVMEALRHLVIYHELRGEYQDASEYARRQVELEPWHEAAHRQLMRALALSGKRSAALKQYQTCRRMLADELGVEPAPKTTELFEQIRDGQYERPESLPRRTAAKVKDPLKPRSFRLRAWVIVSLLFIVLSLGLLTGLLLRNSHRTAAVHVTDTVAASLRPDDTPTAVYSSTGQADIFQIERQTLVTLYNETGGLGWKDSSGWLSDAPPCTWLGVTCSGGSVIELNLPENNLSGSIPPQIGQLTNLRALNLDNNRLSGSMPPELGNLTRLRHLYLSDNLLSGSIPAQWGNLSNLTVLVLTNNQLSGPLPSELGNLGNLEAFAVQGNQFLSGPIPPEIGKLSNLGLLDLNSNQLSGSLPTELGNLSNLRTLIISWNPLSGPLPMSLMNLNNQTFYFEGTDLCEPPDAAFQEWLNSIYDLQSTGVLCQSEG